MSISPLARAIAESPTLALNEKAARLKDQGQAVIHLGSGEPKIKAPIDALLAASAKLATAEVKYTPTDGIPALKKAVLRYTEEHYGALLEPENVIVAPGAKAALYALLMSLVDWQDEVIVTAPYWVSYPEMVRMVRGTPVIVRPEHGRFEPRVEDIEEAISSSTKAIIVNSPNNPSGAVYSEDFVRRMVALAEERGLWLIMDDIYHQLIFDGQRPVSAMKYLSRPFEDSRLIIVNGISKLYGMTGFRIGWTVAPKKVVEVMVNVQGQMVSCPSALLQHAAAGALMGMQTAVDALRLQLQNARDVMVRELSALPGVHVEKPGGTFYCLPDFSHFDTSSERLSRFLLDKALVATVPGKEFGMEGHLRLSYCGSMKDITEGVARIRWALDPNAPREIFVGDRKLVRDWR